MRMGLKHLWPFNPNNRAVNITTSHNYCLFASFSIENFLTVDSLYVTYLKVKIKQKVEYMVRFPNVAEQYTYGVTSSCVFW